MSDQPAKKFKDMTGVVFKNGRRTKDTQPHWTGRVSIQGKEYLVSLWEKTDRSDMMSMAVTDPASLPPRPSDPRSPSQESNTQDATKTGSSSPSQNTSASTAGDDDIFSDLFGSLGS